MSVHSKHLPSWLPKPTHIDIASLDLFDQKWKKARFMPWRFFYIDYEMLQREIAHAIDSEVVSKKLLDEWEKVHEFYMLKSGEIDRRILSFQEQNRSTSLPCTFKSLLLEIFQLYRFTKLNYDGFLHLFMQLDRLLGSSIELRRIVINKPFWKDSTDYYRLAVEANFLYMTSSLVATKKPLSLLQQYNITTFLNTLQQDYTKVETDQVESYSHVTLPQQQANVNINAFKTNNVLCLSPSSSSTHSCETRLSSETSLHAPHQHQKHSYWVHPSNILEVMLYLSDKMLAIQGSNTSQETAIHEIGYSAKSNITESQYKMTTLYMDTPQLSGYTHRSNKQHDTLMTRVRWYDSISSGTEETVEASHAMIEQKTYDNDTDRCWVQQRVWLKSKHLQPWLCGSFSLGSMLSKNSCQYHTDEYSTNLDDVREMKESCMYIENQVHTKQIAPVLKVTQNRIVYTSMDHSITLSIDSDIAMMRAFPTEHANVVHSSVAKSQHTDMYSDGVVHFPYCVVQISTSTDNAESNDNKWLLNLMKCSMLTPVDTFSAYLHGVEALLVNQHNAKPYLNWQSVQVVDDSRSEGLLQEQVPQQVGTKTGLDSMQTASGVSSHGSSSRSNSSRDTHYCSTDTIATVITCYDDDMDEKQQPQVESPTTIDSPLLHPHDNAYQPQRNGMRQSFDSYCSFDHPTSSRSDPTNCKSCMGSMLFVEHQSMDMRDHLPIVSVYEKDTITFSSFLLQTFWPRKFRSFEKEPLLPKHYHHQHKKYRSTSSNSVSSNATCGNIDSMAVASQIQIPTPANLTGDRFSRATVLTLTCVVMSFSMSCILYITVLSKL